LVLLTIMGNKQPETAKEALAEVLLSTNDMGQVASSVSDDEVLKADLSDEVYTCRQPYKSSTEGASSVLDVEVLKVDRSDEVTKPRLPPSATFKTSKKGTQKTTLCQYCSKQQRSLSIEDLHSLNIFPPAAPIVYDEDDLIVQFAQMKRKGTVPDDEKEVFMVWIGGYQYPSNGALFKNPTKATVDLLLKLLKSAQDANEQLRRETKEIKNIADEIEQHYSQKLLLVERKRTGDNVSSQGISTADLENEILRLAEKQQNTLQGQEHWRREYEKLWVANRTSLMVKKRLENEYERLRKDFMLASALLNTPEGYSLLNRAQSMSSLSLKKPSLNLPPQLERRTHGASCATTTGQRSHHRLKSSPENLPSIIISNEEKRKSKKRISLLAQISGRKKMILTPPKTTNTKPAKYNTMPTLRDLRNAPRITEIFT